jgi:hypothetical protein
MYKNEEAGMSGRGRGSAAVRRGRKSAFAFRYVLASLIALVCLVCIPSVAGADVDSVGGLEPASTSLKGGLHEVNPLVNSSHNGEYKCGSAWEYSDFHDEAFGLVMGNCKAGWIFEVVDYGGPNEGGVYSYGGYAEGPLDGCGWVESNTSPEKIGTVREPHHCGSGSEVSTPEEDFREKYNGEGVGAHTADGYYVVNKVPCKEYANFRPWSKATSGEKEEIRTVPAYATERSDIPALKWRYVTKYESTDGTGKYVMVRDTRINGGEGNWVFVPRSCLPSTLPESEGELVPSSPTVTTGTPTGIGTTSATLVGFVNPNGVDTKYFFEYGTTTSYGSYTATEDAGSGTGVVQENVPISGLAPGTTYYFRIVASSATGESFGGPVAFTTVPLPPTATTGGATVQFRRATLNGTVNPNGASTQYYYQYGLTSSYGYVTSEGNAGSGSSPVSAPAVATGLEPSTTYHCRIVAINSGGTSYGGDEIFTTAAPPSLSVSKHLPSSSSMTLTWTASANASSYTIKRNGATVGSTAGLSYVDTKLNATTFYHYEIVANDENESAGSNTVTRATTQVDTIEVDVTGNGKADLVYVYPGSYIDTFLSKGNGEYEGRADHLEEFDSTAGLWLSGDFNGDGKTDLAYIYPGGYIDTFFSKGNGEYEEKTYQVSKEFDDTGGTWEVGDFSGNGKDDLAYIYPGGYIDTFFSKGNGEYEGKAEHIEGFDDTTGQWLTGDFNGNGKTDLGYIYPGGYIDTFFSKGNGEYEGKAEHIEGFDDTTGQWLTGDANGDGDTDLLYIYPGSYIDTFLSKGDGEYEGKADYLEGFDSTTGIWLG